MKKIDRRTFLRWAAMGLGAHVLSACGADATQVPTSPPPAPTDLPPSPTSLPDATTAPTEPGATPAPITEPAPVTGPPHLVVARGGTPEALVQHALAALGGIERFVSAGDDVIIKPNICVAYHTYEYAATTNPWVVGELVRQCVGAGARRVRVMDFPFGGTADQAYITSGIEDQVHAAGGEMEVMAPFKFVETNLPEALDLRRCSIYDDVLNADVLIDVPIAKHHSLARLTLGMKNLMGVIYDRPAMHVDLGQRLADLASHVRPTLTVVDAVRVLMRNGPTGGNLNDVQQMDALIASTDIVAADAYAATLFDLRPDDLAYVRAGATMGLGRSDLENLSIEEISVGG